MSNAAVHIGHDAAVIDKLDQLMRLVLESQAGDKVKIAAIEAVSTALAVQGNSINNCVFRFDKEENKWD